MASKALNLSIDEEVIEDFRIIAKRLGIYPSGWVEARMRDFIEEHQRELAVGKKKK